MCAQINDLLTNLHFDGVVMNGLKGDPVKEDEDEESEQELVIEQHNVTLLAQLLELQDKRRKRCGNFKRKRAPE